MKFSVALFFVVFVVHSAMGQYGNEWIRFDQPYLRIPVGSAGLHRLGAAELQQAGLSGSVDPRTFQLFHRGSEQAIVVAGEGDGTFDEADYIEFYGRGNDGVLDSTLYGDPRHQPHRYYNLYTDAAAYFLTWGAGPGKRMVLVSASSDGLSPDTYHHAERMLILTDSYSGGVDYGDVQQSFFDEGEGWTGVPINQGGEVTYVLDSIREGVPSAGKPFLEMLLTGRGPMVHRVEVVAGTRLLSALSFSGYQSHQFRQEIEWTDIDASGLLAVRVKVVSVGVADRVSVGYIRLRWPQATDMDSAREKWFATAGSAGTSSHLMISGAPAGARVFDVTDHDDVTELTATVNGGILGVVAPGVAPRRILVSAQRKSPGPLKLVRFRRFQPGSQDYVIITHPSLRKPASGYVDPVKAFAEYRHLPDGGGFDTLIVNIDQLYDQFNYGEESPRAIFQFMKFLGSAALPDYLFLIGKGLDVNYNYRRRPSSFPEYKDLVPTGGFPASDMAFSARLSPDAQVAAIATGRLTATSPEDVAAYFDKVKERDALPFNDLWRKKILHLGGGIEQYEPAMFRDILRDLETVAEGLFLGGEVQTVSKADTGVRLVNIAEEINAGLGLVTFFGHSAPNTTDFDIGRVTDPVMGYNNKGRYPFLLMNGCDAGSYFLNAQIFGEDWVMAKDKGAVGFIAHSAYGKLSGLQRYASAFYNVAFADSAFIRMTIGKVQQEVSRRYLRTFGSSPASVTQTQQMVLLGDPALKLFGAGGPDHAVEESGISIEPFDGDPLTAYADSFLIRIPVRNTGVADSRKVRLEVVRQFRDEPPVSYDTIIAGVLNSDTLSVVLRKTDSPGHGINLFTVTVDADDFIDELDETNNSATIEYFIPLNHTRNLYPYNYAIVNTADIDLTFQYTGFQESDRNFFIELDTVDTFDSPARTHFTVNTSLLGKLRAKLWDMDSLVYYWRTRIADPDEDESGDWTTSSFTFIGGGPEGWAQVHFPQFRANDVNGLVRDPELRRLRYEETTSEISMLTFPAEAGYPVDSVSVRINGVEFNLVNQGAACRNNTLNLIAFDRSSTRPYPGLFFTWHELLYTYGGRRLLCGREPYVINSFTPAELITGNGDDLSQYIGNVGTGDSVVLFNIGNAGIGQWPDEVKALLETLGISTMQLAEVSDGDAFVIFGRKGSVPGSAMMFHMAAEPVRVEKTIEGRFTSGHMVSVPIGPAKRWDRLLVSPREAGVEDAFDFTVLGLRADGVVDTLRTGIVADVDLSFIDPAWYPHLRIVFRSSDPLDLTSVQLKKWLVLFEPVAEGLLYFTGPWDAEEVPEGDTLHREFGFVNVSDKTFPDSLTVHYDLVSPSRPRSAMTISQIPAPLPGDTTRFTLPVSTTSRTGLNDLHVFVNPRIAAEESYENNVLVLREHVNVVGDRWAPVIDVTFDGEHLEDNEFVRADPLIVITMWDENPFILKKDTVGIDVFLATPCAEEECAFRRIPFSDEDIAWTPAGGDEMFTIRFSPGDLQEGVYTLRVQGEDARGNASAAAYTIRFRVRHEQTLEGMLPYPNPFALETTFQIIMTGRERGTVSGDLRITNLSGAEVARVILPDDALRVGTNRIVWDGRTADGQALPDGMYLFRLVLRDAGGERRWYGKLALHRN